MTDVCAWLAAHGSSCLELVAVLFGVVAVFLSVRQSVWSWPVALVNVALYFVLFYRSGLYSDMGLQAVYFALSLYGWYQWLYGGEGNTALAVSHTTPRTAIVLVLVGIAGWALLGTITSRLPGAVVPWVDAATATVSLVAQYMMTRKLLENWMVWIAVDIVYVGLFIWRGLYLTSANYAIYLVLAVLGHIAWQRSIHTAPRAAQPAV